MCLIKTIFYFYSKTKNDMNRIFILMIVAFITSCTQPATFLNYKLGCTYSEFDSTTKKLLREGTLVDLFEPGCRKVPNPAFPFILPNGHTVLGAVDGRFIDDKLVRIEIVLFKRPYCEDRTLDAELIEPAKSVAEIYVEKYGTPDSIFNELPTQLSHEDLYKTQEYKWVRKNEIVGITITPWKNDQAYCRIYYTYDNQTLENLHREQLNKQKQNL